MTTGQKCFKATTNLLGSMDLNVEQKAKLERIKNSPSAGIYDPIDIMEDLEGVNDMFFDSDIEGLLLRLKIYPRPPIAPKHQLFVDGEVVGKNEFFDETILGQRHITGMSKSPYATREFKAIMGKNVFGEESLLSDMLSPELRGIVRTYKGPPLDSKKYHLKRRMGRYLKSKDMICNREDLESAPWFRVMYNYLATNLAKHMGESYIEPREFTAKNVEKQFSPEALKIGTEFINDYYPLKEVKKIYIVDDPIIPNLPSDVGVTDEELDALDNVRLIGVNTNSHGAV